MTMILLRALAVCLAIHGVLAVPSESPQTALSDEYATTEYVEPWTDIIPSSVKQGDTVYELFTHPTFSDYQMRVVEPTLCDPDVKQYSGYLDISDGKHLFFWFFESRTSPDEDPLILWLNGGPGCSSSTGLFFELGPCTVVNEGLNVTHNPYSWNNRSNIIFLDQPVNVGFSYTDDGSTVGTSPVAGVDVYAFLQLFLSRFKKYQSAPFHIAAESYGGTYAPHIASVIHKKNAEMNTFMQEGLLKINLASVVLANGYTNPYIQAGMIPEYLCNGPYAIYNDSNGPECTTLRRKIAVCQRLIKGCNTFDSRLTCVPAMMYCGSVEGAEVRKTGLNPYDLRVKCDDTINGPLCFKQMQWVETYLNQPEIKKAIGAEPSREFVSCSNEVGREFAMHGDDSHNPASLLPDLVNDGIRLLVYAGIADSVCDFMGNEAWLLNLDTKFHSELLTAASEPWINNDTNSIAGTARSAGNPNGAGNVTFVVVYEAGHMVPLNQPENALDLINRWIGDVPFSS